MVKKYAVIVLALWIGFLAEACPAMELHLSSGQVIYGEFRGINKNLLYLVAGNKLFKVEGQAIIKITENGEELGYEYLEEVPITPINFNKNYDISAVNENNQLDPKLLQLLEENKRIYASLYFNHRAAAKDVIAEKYYFSIHPTNYLLGWYKIDFGRRWLHQGIELVISPSYLKFFPVYNFIIPPQRRISVSTRIRKYSGSNYRGIYLGVGVGGYYRETWVSNDCAFSGIRVKERGYGFYPVIELGKTIHLFNKFFIDGSLSGLAQYDYEKDEIGTWQLSKPQNLWFLPSLGFGMVF